MTPALAALILAVRSCCVALIKAIDAFDDALPMPEEAKPVPEEDENGKCLHPEKMREYAPTFKYQKRFQCKRCGTLELGEP